MLTEFEVEVYLATMPVKVSIQHLARGGDQRHGRGDIFNKSFIVQWSRENFGANIIETHRTAPVTSYTIKNENRWTYWWNDFYFQDENDAMLFKLKFG